jgi:EAL domain-containing protein (putative c-di-GMP-specific phosphodiesterase class I)
VPKPPDFGKLGCADCIRGAVLDFDISMAFQPIVNLDSGHVFAQEALVRGANNESAAHVFEHVNDSNRYRFDQVCRAKAIELGSSLLDSGQCLSINFMPLAVYRPELCIRTTLEAAKTFGFPVNRIIFEITESEKVDDVGHVQSIVDVYKELGFLVAIDDFGAGHSGLNLLADLHSDIVKLDMKLIRDIDTDLRRRSIVRAIIQASLDLSMRVIAEGVETRDEISALRDLGVGLFQGYYFARPSFRSLAVTSPELNGQ